MLKQMVKRLAIFLAMLCMLSLTVTTISALDYTPFNPGQVIPGNGGNYAQVCDIWQYGVCIHDTRVWVPPHPSWELYRAPSIIHKHAGSYKSVCDHLDYYGNCDHWTQRWIT